MPQERSLNAYNADNVQDVFELAEKCARAYNISTKVGCIVIDSSGKMTYDACENASCRINSLLAHYNDFGKACSNSHLYGVYQAERFGGKYIYACPHGLIHWTAPLISRGVLQGAIVAGPAQVVDSSEFLVEELIRKDSIPENLADDMLELLKTVPILTSEEIDQMSDLLFIVGAHISDIPTTSYYEDREYLEQQSDISEFIHLIKTLGGDENSITSYPIKKEKELTSLISIGDKAGSQKILNEIFGHIFFTSGGSFEVIKARILELIVLLSRAAMEGGADVEQIFGLNYKYTSEIHGFHTVEELTYWLSKIMVRFTDCVFNLTDVKHVDVIYRAIEYIKKNYMKKITLEEVASHVYLSPSYFSKIFKDEMKLNFNTYLNYVRIEMSKKLLLDDSIVLVDVSNLVGYEDQSYFSKVFKKVTGVSPGKFRGSRGQVR
ncbi:MAG: PocR ligand-binding domain-containing protein [Oscillospiraceae bacterium]|nr:PocR ligand-binding domain-containing protein [Oscillospiraceae bacterium]